MSTSGRKKSLAALNKRKETNLKRVAQGKAPIKDGKRVSAKKIKGLPNTKAGAQKKLAARKKK